VILRFVMDGYRQPGVEAGRGCPALSYFRPTRPWRTSDKACSSDLLSLINRLLSMQLETSKGKAHE
jgi:hypothetical protein